MGWTPEYYERNRERILAKSRERYQIKGHKYDAGQSRARTMLRKYGMTPEQYDAMALDQDHVCAICQEGSELFVDHDHTTGRVRGLLCKHCNLALGHFRDSTTAMQRAVDYLSPHAHLPSDEWLSAGPRLVGVTGSVDPGEEVN